MRDAVHAGLGGMDGERRGEEAEAWESAPFAVNAEDYRRAFAWAVATLPQPPPFRGEWMHRAVRAWIAGSLIGLLGAAVWGVQAFADYRMAPWQGVAEIGRIAGGAALLMVPAALIVSLYQSWDARGWRRRFPRERAAWKRPGRMRIRWSDAGLVLAGQEGFGSVGWNRLHTWIDAPDALVIFTAPFDPVPVPHAALGTDGLDDLRHRLHAAEVPQAWRPMSGEALGLKRVFD